MPSTLKLNVSGCSARYLKAGWWGSRVRAHAQGKRLTWQVESSASGRSTSGAQLHGTVPEREGAMLSVKLWGGPAPAFLQARQCPPPSQERWWLPRSKSQLHTALGAPAAPRRLMLAAAAWQGHNRCTAARLPPQDSVCCAAACPSGRTRDERLCEAPLLLRPTPRHPSEASAASRHPTH